MDGTGRATKLMLDDMVQYFEDDDEYYYFPEQRFQEIMECMQQGSLPRTLEAHDASWRRIYEYYVDQDSQWGDSNLKYLEFDLDHPKTFGRSPRQYEVLEPCNYASNIVYYSNAIRACENQWKTFNKTTQQTLVTQFFTITAASSFFHASMAESLGNWDGSSVRAIVNFGYQMIIRGIASDSKAFLAGGPDVAQRPVREIVEIVTYLPLNTSIPIPQWGEDYLSTLPFADTLANAFAFFYFSCAALLPLGICETTFDSLGELVLTDDFGRKEFFFEQYIPEIRKIVETENFPVSFWKGLPLAQRLAALIAETGYAALFAEQRGGFNFIVDSPILRTITNIINPVVTTLFGWCQNIGNSDTKGYNGQGEDYPSAKYCNRKSPHALWHQNSAKVLFSLMVFVDDLSDVIQEHITKQN